MSFRSISENLNAYREEAGSHPVALDRVLGFTFIRAWVYLMFVGAAASSMTWSGEQIPPLFYVVSTASLCAVLFGSALAGERFVRFMTHPAARFAAPALTTGGTLLLASSAAGTGAALSFGILGAITTGIGSGLIDLGYGELYRNEPPARATLEVPLAFFLAAVAFSLVIMLPSVVGCLICSLLPAISGWILFVEQHAWSRKHQASVLPIDFDLKSFAWRIGVCACLVGVADGMVRAAFLSSNNLSIHVFLQWPLAGYGTFNVLIWMLLAEISSNYRLSSTEVFGIGWGMVTLGVLLGSIAGNIVDRFAPFTPQFLSLIALIATMAVLLSFLFVFRESDLIALTEEPESEAESAEDRALASSSDVPPAASDNPRPRFQDRCLEVAAAFELSPKETEVMILFAKGRSAARIQEELFISKGTVSTHLRHIYQKMDVHSKQEMLDVIEGVIRE